MSPGDHKLRNAVRRASQALKSTRPAEPPAPAPAPAKHGAKVRSTLARARLDARRIRATVTSDASVAIDATLTAKIGSRTITLGHTTASGRTVHLAIRLTAGGRRALAKAHRAALTLYIEARDADGNLTTTRAHRVLRR